MPRIQTRKVLDASTCDGAAADKQSATARRSGSGGFLREEDLRRDMEGPPNCILEIAGLLEGLKLVDITVDVCCCWSPVQSRSDAFGFGFQRRSRERRERGERERAAIAIQWGQRSYR